MVIFNDPFASLAHEFEKAFAQPVKTTNYPPYNVMKVNDDHFVMEFALAGFGQKEVDITVDRGVLTIKAEHTEDKDANYIYKGIAARKFSRSFSLPEYFEVERASMIHGILYIDLYRHIPEEKKPKKIEVK
jgi:molecular chaperone IbpA